jgi:hypothetical protein
MILATRRSAKNVFVGWKAGWCFHSNSFYGKRRSEVPEKEWQRIGNQIEAAFIFARSYVINMNGKCKAIGSVYGTFLLRRCA